MQFLLSWLSLHIWYNYKVRVYQNFYKKNDVTDKLIKKTTRNSWEQWPNGWGFCISTWGYKPYIGAWPWSLIMTQVLVDSRKRTKTVIYQLRKHVSQSSWKYMFKFNTRKSRFVKNRTFTNSSGMHTVNPICIIAC